MAYMALAITWLWSKSPVLATTLIIFGPPMLAASPFIAVGMWAFELATLVLFVAWLALITWRFG